MDPSTVDELGGIDASTLKELRASLPALSDWAYLNTGTAGPMPDVVADAMAAAVEGQRREARSGPEHGERTQTLKSEVRTLTARMLHANVGEIALTHNTTEGMNLATLGINWAPGDEAVTTTVEHPGALFPLYAAQSRFNLTIKTANVAGKDDAAVLETFGRVIGPRTRLVSISHVSFQTGQVLPVKEIAALAHERGALLLVDGAQSFGAMAIDVAELGCDFYAVPGQKWLCGPEGSGALYCAQDIVSQTRVTFAGYGTAEGYNDYGGFQIRGTAQRFEQGTANLAVFAGQRAAMEWLSETVTEPAAYGRASALADYAIERLATVPGYRVLTPSTHAGLVSVLPPDGRAAELVVELRSAGALVRSIPGLGALRLSTGFFNTTEDIDLVVDVLGRSAS